MSLNGTIVAENQSINPAAATIGFFAGMGSVAVLPAAMAPAAGATFAAMTTAMSTPGDLNYLAIPNALLGGIAGTLLGPLATSLAVGYATYVVTDSVMECLWPKQTILNQYSQNKKSSSGENDIAINLGMKKLKM